jgi:hypothetical protein
MNRPVKTAKKLPPRIHGVGRVTNQVPSGQKPEHGFNLMSCFSSDMIVSRALLLWGHLAVMGLWERVCHLPCPVLIFPDFAIITWPFRNCPEIQGHEDWWKRIGLMLSEFHCKLWRPFMGNSSAVTYRTAWCSVAIPYSKGLHIESRSGEGLFLPTFPSDYPESFDLQW